MTLHTVTVFACGLGVGAVLMMFATAFYMVREFERRDAERTERIRKYGGVRV